MTDIQKENLIRLHRTAADLERRYRELASSGTPVNDIDSLRAEWEAAESELAAYREYLATLRMQRTGDGTADRSK